MRYVPWVSKVFRAIGDASRGSLGSGISLAAIGGTLGFGELTYEDFVVGGEPARALMTAMTDLDEIGLVDFQKVDHGNKLKPHGRDLLTRSSRARGPTSLPSRLPRQSGPSLPGSIRPRLTRATAGPISSSWTPIRSTLNAASRPANTPTRSPGSSSTVTSLAYQERTTRNTASSSGPRGLWPALECIPIEPAGRRP